MLVILKRGGLLFLALLLIVTFLVFSLYSPSAAETAVEMPFEVILIDPGHGAPDGGATGVKTGALEKDLNLAVSGKVRSHLENAGYTVSLTRETDAGLHENEKASLREKKRADMRKRVMLAKEDGVCLFASIHMNFFTDGKYSGPQVFYQANSAEGKRLAEEIRLSFLNEIGPHCTRETKPRTDLYLLRETPVPAVVIECGFLSNPEEDALLSTEAYQDCLAAAIASGIQNFLKEA